MSDTSRAPAPATGSLATPAPVTAVVVTRGATTFLPTTLRALAGQTRGPARVLVVDAGAAPDPELAGALREAGLPAAATTLLTAPGARTFGDAVRAAVAAEAGLPGGGQRWLWLLHDDSAPDPPALAELVRAVQAAPSVGVAGVKQRTWTAPARLLEVGVRTSRSGRRMTDVEPGEVDQGQHDGREDVLGVGLAGALVRRDVWEELGGTDPALGPFGDGLDLSRRARLAGHRVLAVPSAVVRHAQATYHGLRDGHAVAEVVDLDADGEPDGNDPRRSYAARRTALLHQRLVWAPLPLLPLVVLMAVLAGVVRVLVRVATKEPALAAAEVVAPVRALGRPVAVLRARAGARRTRRMPRRTLRPLQADLRTVWRQWRDRRLTRAEARRVVRAPSELELRELAQLAVRRRGTLALVAVALAAVTAAALGPQVLGVLGGRSLVGGALVGADGGVRDLWDAATGGWVPGGLGGPGPADAFLAALLPGAVLAGGSPHAAVAVLLLGAVPLAGLGAWFAAGAATRSVGVRAWAALAWAALPTLLLAVGDGRAGAVLVHVALPWLVLALARAVGAQQTDRITSGVATAARTEPGETAQGPGAQEWPDPEAWARAGEAPATRRGRRARPAPPRRRGPAPEGSATDAARTGDDVRDDAGSADAGSAASAGIAASDPPTGPADVTVSGDAGAGGTGPEDAAAAARDEAGDVTPVRGTPAVASARPVATARLTGADAADGPGTDEADGPGTDEADGPAGALAHGPGGAPVEDDHPDPAPEPSGSLAAAAAASLAFAAVAAGAPALLLPGVLLLFLVATCARRGRRLRVVLAALPALVLLGPLLAEAAARGTQGLRLLLADPGSPLAANPASGTAALLGVPADAAALVPGWVPDAVAPWWPAATGAAVLLLALAALLRGAPQARAVRLGWVTAALGLAVALVAGRVAVGQDDGVVVVGWPGAGVSLAAAGLLTAAVTGTRGLRARLEGVTFGWRQLTAGVVTVLVVLLPLSGWAGWVWQSRVGGAGELTTRERAVVPAIGRQAQESADAARVLAVAPAADGALDWQLLRGDGPQLTEQAAAARTADLAGPLTRPDLEAADPATAEVESVVGTLSVGSSTDVAADLAALGVADVLVPPLPATVAGDVAPEQQRSALVGRLDSTPGLERITEGVAGVIWRVQPTGPAEDDGPAGATTTAWARLVPDARAAAGAEGLAAGTAVAAVPGVRPRVETTVGPGGADRLLVLAERADPGWRATLDGVPLRAVSDGWRQTFEVGADGGRLVVEHRSTDRVIWTAAQVAVGALALLLALPVRRRRAGRR